MIETELPRHLILVIVAILLGGLLLVPLKWPLGNHASFSQHVARHRSAIIYYNLLFTVTLPLLFIFFAGWFVPRYHLSIWFLAFIFFASLFQYLVTVIPETGAWKTTLHRILAGWSAVFLLPPMIMLTLSDSVGVLGRIAAGISLLMMLIISLITFLHKARHPHLLILQASYFGAFFVAILIITYL